MVQGVWAGGRGSSNLFLICPTAQFEAALPQCPNCGHADGTHHPRCKTWLSKGGGEQDTDELDPMQQPHDVSEVEGS